MLPCLVGLAGTELSDEERRLLLEFRPAGILFFKRNVRDAQQMGSLCNELRELLGDGEADPILAADHEGGAVSVLEAAIGAPPSALALGMADRPQLTRESFLETGRRLRSIGINLLLAPVADVLAGENQVLSTRAFGSSAQAVGGHVQAAIAGLKEAGVAACVKHWPGHGRPRADSHLELPRNEATLDELLRVELPPFVEAFEAGVESVMVAHLAVPALDSSGRPASVSPTVVEDWLRSRLDYRGLILSDALEMAAFAEEPTACLEAGCDLVLLADPIGRQGPRLRALQEPGTPSRRHGRLLEFRAGLRQQRALPARAPEGDAVYARARREGVSVLWPQTREMSTWPPAAENPLSWALLDAASGDRLVRSPVDRRLRVGEAAETSTLAPILEAALGRPAEAPLLLPPPGQGGLESIAALSPGEAVDLLFLASLRPFNDAEWGLLEPRLGARCATILLGDLSSERRLPRDRGVVLVPGVRPEDAELAVGLLRGSIAHAASGRWGD